MPVDKKDAKEAFDFVDGDKNEFLTFEEIKDVCNRLGCVLSDDEIKQLIKEVDTSGDGKINFEEFYSYVEKNC